MAIAGSNGKVKMSYLKVSVCKELSIAKQTKRKALKKAIAEFTKRHAKSDRDLPSTSKLKAAANHVLLPQKLNLRQGHQRKKTSSLFTRPKRLFTWPETCFGRLSLQPLSRAAAWPKMHLLRQQFVFLVGGSCLEEAPA